MNILNKVSFNISNNIIILCHSLIVTKKYQSFQFYFTLSLFSSDVMSMSKTVVSDLLSAFPGIDEAMSFAEVMKYDFVS